MRLAGTSAFVWFAWIAALLLVAAGNTWPARAQQHPTINQAPAASPAAAAQSTDTATSTLREDARLVNVPITVYDKKGELVQNLTKDNFLLQVDKTAQTIRYFNLDTDLPLSLGLLVDTSMSQRDAIDDERAASTAFLDDMLNGPADRDKAFRHPVRRETDLLQDTTSSKPKLQAALKQLQTSSYAGDSQSGVSPSEQQGPGSGSGSSSGGARRGGGTTLYDALFLSSDELMSKLKGRKAVIILSDGVDRGSKETLMSSIEAAQRADTIVYAIYFKGREQSNPDRGFHQGNPGTNAATPAAVTLEAAIRVGIPAATPEGIRAAALLASAVRRTSPLPTAGRSLSAWPTRRRTAVRGQQEADDGGHLQGDRQGAPRAIPAGVHSGREDRLGRLPSHRLGAVEVQPQGPLHPDREGYYAGD